MGRQPGQEMDPVRDNCRIRFVTHRAPWEWRLFHCDGGHRNRRRLVFAVSIDEWRNRPDLKIEEWP